MAASNREQNERGGASASASASACVWLKAMQSHFDGRVLQLLAALVLWISLCKTASGHEAREVALWGEREERRGRRGTE